MRKSAIEQVRLQARAKAAADAVSAAKFAENTGRTAVEGLEEFAQGTKATAEAHIKEHGEWCP